MTETQSIVGDFYIKMPPAHPSASRIAISIQTHYLSNVPTPEGDYAVVIKSKNECLAIREDGSLVGSPTAVLQDIESVPVDDPCACAVIAALGILRSLTTDADQSPSRPA